MSIKFQTAHIQKRVNFLLLHCSLVCFNPLIPRFHSKPESFWKKFSSMTIQMKANEQYFHVVRTVYLAVQVGSNF